MSVTAEGKDFTFGYQVKHTMSQPANDKLSLKGAWSGSCDQFQDYTAPINIIWNG